MPFKNQVHFKNSLSVDTQRRQWHPTPVPLPGKFHGQRRLVGCGPWGLEEPDMTEWLHFHFSLSCIGEGNGNPLQCSCLENPRDGGASRAAAYGVTQSQTWLKQLSSSSSSMDTSQSGIPTLMTEAQSVIWKVTWSYRERATAPLVAALQQWLSKVEGIFWQNRTCGNLTTQPCMLYLFIFGCVGS